MFGTLKDKYRQIGNAVPISLGYAIGKQVIKLIKKEKIDLPPNNFPFSRYLNTNEVTFKEQIEKKRQKYLKEQKMNNNQPDLFDC